MTIILWIWRQAATYLTNLGKLISWTLFKTETFSLSYWAAKNQKSSWSFQINSYRAKVANLFKVLSLKEDPPRLETHLLLQQGKKKIIQMNGLLKLARSITCNTLRLLMVCPVQLGSLQSSTWRICSLSRSQ